ncbi:hypothetical protein R5R35_005437 [Gryllus longicercus]|uniref:MARVEL domain-containing protein n=1 Tax=Gryllus longicercus TaxID=2509291 RepID=A0AAN9V9Q7_9ORTH|nr:Putative members of chemokine-like factor super family [Gryllus bimaculatus]
MMSAAESQPPPQTAAKTEIGAQASFPKINIEHFRTLPGIVKLVQLAFGIICMACASPAYLQGTHWFLFVATVSFITTLLWVFVYLLSVREELNLPINWVLSELMNTGVDTVLYFIACIVQLAVWGEVSHPYRAANITAGVFGILNTVAYGLGTYFLFVQWKSSRTPTN